MLSNRNLERESGGESPQGREERRTELHSVRPDGASCCRTAARLAARHYGVSFNEAVGRKRGSRRGTRARHVAMYLAHVVFGLSFAQVGAGFQRDRTTVAYACAQIEDLRDNPAFDAALAGLELSAGVLRDLGLAEKAA